MVLRFYLVSKKKKLQKYIYKHCADEIQNRYRLQLKIQIKINNIKYYSIHCMWK